MKLDILRAIGKPDSLARMETCAKIREMGTVLLSQAKKTPLISFS